MGNSYEQITFIKIKVLPMCAMQKNVLDENI